MPFITFPHKCMYDTETLLRILTKIGFKAEERKGMESTIDDIRNIEDETRTLNAVIVEGKKV